MNMFNSVGLVVIVHRNMWLVHGVLSRRNGASGYWVLLFCFGNDISGSQPTCSAKE